MSLRLTALLAVVVVAPFNCPLHSAHGNPYLSVVNTAKQLHTGYRDVGPSCGTKTRDACSEPWDALPYTTWRCEKPFPERTCVFENLYFAKGILNPHTTKARYSVIVPPGRSPDEMADLRKSLRMHQGARSSWDGTATTEWTPLVFAMPKRELWAKFTSVKVVEKLHIWIMRAHSGNIGHTLYDDFAPIYQSVVMDLGISEDELRSAQMLANDPGEGWKRALFAKRVLQTHEGMQPDTCPLLFKDLTHLVKQGESALIMSRLVSGFGSRAGHTFTRDYAASGHEKHAYAHFRRYLLGSYKVEPAEGMNATTTSFTRRKVPKGEKPNMVLLLKPDKRRWMNSGDMHAAAVKEFPAWNVETLMWHQLPSYRAEVIKLQTIDILVSADGTGAMNSVFLPPGSVLIALGHYLGQPARDWFATISAKPNLYGPDHYGVLADFIYNAYTHVKVLYYSNHCSRSAWNEKDANVFTDQTAFIDALHSAVQRWEARYSLPISGLGNYNPRGVQCRTLFKQEGENWYKHFLNPDKCAACDVFLNNPAHEYARCAPNGVPPTMPAGFLESLQADVSSVEHNVIGRGGMCSFNMASISIVQPHNTDPVWYGAILLLIIAIISVTVRIMRRQCPSCRLCSGDCFEDPERKPVRQSRPRHHFRTKATRQQLKDQELDTEDTVPTPSNN